jgi:pimeloyl-ACP methyl ester carboxylesterase
VPRILANGLRLEVEARGDPAAPTVLLVMGLGMQLVAWPEALCRALLDAGFRVIRFDNRDVGLSEGCEDAPRANLMLAAMRWMLRLPVAAPYTIESLAEDLRGVLDAMGARQAHVVGVSLGGMVAQSFAAAYPERCLSLASIMSSSGDRRLPPADLSVLRLLLSRPPAGAGTAELAAHFTRLFLAIGTPGQDPAGLEARVRAGVERSYRPDGTARQLLAVLASGDRSAQLARIAAPTLVLHGDADPLVPPEHGEDCARKIPGARLVRIPGMGHDLADAILPEVIASLLAHLEAARAAGHTRH